MMRRPPLFAVQRFAKPWALWQGYASVLKEVLLTDPAALAMQAEKEIGRSYDIVDGVAIVPIRGILVHECTWWWDETSYDAIADVLRAVDRDPEVKAICLHVNSPGGEVAGCFDLAEVIFTMRRADRPIWAIVDENAYSAAYALASAADRIVVPRTGGTGSIGVIAMHVDVTKALDEFGIKVTTFQFGARKSDSYPTTPLSDEARDRFQADVDLSGKIFVDLVARNRALSAAAVKATEAATFQGPLGVEAGLADAVMSVDAAFLQLAASVA